MAAARDWGSPLHLLNLFVSAAARGCRYLRLVSVISALLLVSLGLAACGQNYYYGGRVLPPSGILNRVMIAAQVTALGAPRGQLTLVDALYDIRHNYKNTVAAFPVNGFNGSSLPVTIQNQPAETAGLVFSVSDGSMQAANYATEAATSFFVAPATNAIATSIFSSTTRTYVIAAQPQIHALEMFDATTSPTTFLLNLPGVFRVSINPAGTIALGFVQNSDLVYSVVHLNAQQQAAAVNNPHYLGAEDCEPQNLPQYCVYQVNAGTASFDQPTKAVFSPDGSSAYVLDCGPECGGVTAGLTRIPLPASALNTGAAGPAGLSLTASQFIPVPGGVTDALFNGNTMYVAGQQLLPDGLFTGELTVINTNGFTVGAPIPISDGTHSRMVLADDNTLWVGSSNCQGGERYRQAQNGGTAAYGCMTMFNTGTNTVTTIESYKGDGTGIAAVTALHKVYTAEGGQVYIYTTQSGASLDNANVTVQGIVTDVAYMDAPDDSDNTWY